MTRFFRKFGLAIALMTLCSCELEYNDFDIYVLRCEANSQTLQLYRGVATDTADSSNLTPVNSPVNGRACSVSTDLQGRSLTLSEAVDAGLTTDAAPKQASAPAPQQPSLYKVFRYLSPSLYNPALPIEDRRRLPATCQANLQAYLVNHLQNTVSAVAICQSRLVRDLPVATNPLQVAITPDGSQAIVTSYDEALTFIDTATNTVKARMSLLNYNPQGIAISPDGSRAYVTHYLDINPALLVIDVPNRRLLSVIRLPQAYPRTVALTPDGSQAWVNYFQGGVITVVDLLTESVAGSVQITQPVSNGMIFNTTGTKAFAAVFPNQIYTIDTATLAVQKRTTVGAGPTDLTLNLTGERLYVGCENDPTVWAIDTRTSTVVHRYLPPGQNSTPGRTMGLLVFR